jgi:hypothetical protein
MDGMAQEKDSLHSGSLEQTLKAFDERVKEYVKLREGVEEKSPELSKDAKAEEIETYKTTFERGLREARLGSKRGDVFTEEVAKHIRAVIRSRFKGTDLQQLREIILEAETKGIPVRVNYPYPSNKELAQIPATLLMVLPPLPKEVRYRFVGRHLLLVDTGNGIIVDYMSGALP